MPEKVKMRLAGRDGNAFALLGAFSRIAKRQGWTAEEVKVVVDQCVGSDYDNLLRVLMENTTETDDE